MFNRLRIDSINTSEIFSEEEFKIIPIKKFSKGSIIYGDQVLCLYIFKNGKAKATIYEDDEEFIMYYLVKNNIIIPEESCCVEFLEDSEVYIIDAEYFAEFFRIKEFAVAVISSLKQRAVIERKIIKNLIFKTCKNRMGTFLLEIAIGQNDIDESSDNLHFYLDLSMKDLATFIGAKRQTVSTVFHELLRDKIIKKVKKNKYTIPSIKKLQEYIELN
jgi:CRP-like cAMP-binding protein